MTNNQDHLKFFHSVRLTPDHRETALDLEDILQIEHLPDGKHPIANESQAGFISPQDIQRIRAMYNYLKGLGVL